MMNKDMAVVVIGFDGYCDIWDDFARLFNHYWPNRSYPVYFANNDKEITFKGMTGINCGADAEWSRKVQRTLAETQEPYICLLLEDFFLGSPIDEKVIIDTLNFIKTEKIKYCKLCDNNRILKEKTPLYRKGKPFHIVFEDTDYGVSLQAAIWEREYLAELVGTENNNAWIFELDRVKESKQGRHIPLEGCISDTRNILNIKHGVLQGQILPNTKMYFEKNGYKLISDRTVMSRKDYFRYVSKQLGKDIIPVCAQRPFKKISSMFGIKFVSDTWNK